MSKTVFLSRNKPQCSDVIDICKKHNRTFIGYPAWRKGYSDLARGMIDLLSSSWDDIEEELDEKCKKKNYRRQIKINWNLVREIDCGCITLIPRPDRGFIYTGIVENFFFEGNPRWADEYIELRRERGLDTKCVISHLSDVAQGWKVDKWRKIPFPAFPAWIRKSFFGRSTVARIHPSRFGNPYEVLDKWIDSPQRPISEWTMEISEIEKRLAWNIGPNEFEHLVVALLQLEQPDRVWRHVGGSGDGGVDGMGSSADGEPCALVQCKWNGGDPEIPGDWKREYYFATLLEDPSRGNDSIYLWDRRKIVELVKKHARRLPWAQAMRIGE